MPDDACAATAFLTGVKSNYGTVGVTPSVQRGTCGVTAEVDKLESIAKWALKAGKAIGMSYHNYLNSLNSSLLKRINSTKIPKLQFRKIHKIRFKRNTNWN